MGRDYTVLTLRCARSENFDPGRSSLFVKLFAPKRGFHRVQVPSKVLFHKWELPDNTNRGVTAKHYLWLPLEVTEQCNRQSARARLSTRNKCFRFDGNKNITHIYKNSWAERLLRKCFNDDDLRSGSGSSSSSVSSRRSGVSAGQDSENAALSVLDPGGFAWGGGSLPPSSSGRSTGQDSLVDDVALAAALGKTGLGYFPATPTPDTDLIRLTIMPPEYRKVAGQLRLFEEFWELKASYMLYDSHTVDFFFRGLLGDDYADQGSRAHKKLARILEKYDWNGQAFVPQETKRYVLRPHPDFCLKKRAKTLSTPRQLYDFYRARQTDKH